MIERYSFLLGLALAVFAVGLLGVLIRRNLLVVVMCLEMMLNAVILAFVTFAARDGTLGGVAMTFFIYVAGACEIALAMALAVLLARRRGSLDLGGGAELRG